MNNTHNIPVDVGNAYRKKISFKSGNFLITKF